MDRTNKPFFNTQLRKDDWGWSRSVGDAVALWSATGGGLGYFSHAPGTWGSLPGLVVGMAFFKVSSLVPAPWSFGVLFVLILGGILGAFFAIKTTENLLQVHDEPRIVIDEIIGQAIAVCVLEPSAVSLLIGFLLFRIFDIWKPGVIGYLDREVPGAWGTLLDDVLAGVIAGVLTVLVILCLQGFGMLA